VQIAPSFSFSALALKLKDHMLRGHWSGFTSFQTPDASTSGRRGVRSQKCSQFLFPCCQTCECERVGNRVAVSIEAASKDNKEKDNTDPATRYHGQSIFCAPPFLGPLLFDNTDSDARDHCANERSTTSYFPALGWLFIGFADTSQHSSLTFDLAYT
jgi:hypothetical protein